MLVKKSRWVDADKYGYEVEDVIAFKLSDGEKMQAMAVKQESDGMLFCSIDCLFGEYSMNETDACAGGYAASTLRRKLNAEIFDRFPAEIKANLVPFENGDLLRLPTEREIFGENIHGNYEDPSCVSQWRPMKKRRNRIAFQGNGGAEEWCWLQSQCRNSDREFVIVNVYGDSRWCTGSDVFGIRPVFKLKHVV